MSTSPFSLTGCRLAITGASRGLGAAIARRCAEAGADVALIARSEEALESLGVELRALDRRVYVLPADVTQRREVDWAFQQLTDAWGGVDALVCNAGLNIRKPLLEMSDEEWETVLQTDLTSMFYCCRAAVPAMAPGSSIVLMGSVAGLVALPTGVAYAAAKAGIHQMARTLTLELGGRGIRVNAIAPWYVETPLTAPLLADPAYRAAVLGATPLGRLGTPDDVAWATQFLVSRASDWISGQTLAVDGGMSTLGFAPLHTTTGPPFFFGSTAD